MRRFSAKREPKELGTLVDPPLAVEQFIGEMRARYDKCYIVQAGVGFEMVHRHDYGGCPACAILNLRDALKKALEART